MIAKRVSYSELVFEMQPYPPLLTFGYSPPLCKPSISRVLTASASFVISGVPNSYLAVSCIDRLHSWKKLSNLHLLLSLLDICLLLRRLDMPDLLIDFRAFF